MRGMNQAPSLVHRHIIKQPFDRTCPAPSLAIFNFANLFGDMDMNWSLACHIGKVAQLVGSDRSQAVRRNADDCVGKRCHRRPCRFVQSCKTVQVVDETALAITRRGSAKTRMCIKDRQEREADPAFRRRCGDRLREACGIRIAISSGIMVQIMKLSDASEARELSKGLDSDGP